MFSVPGSLLLDSECATELVLWLWRAVGEPHRDDVSRLPDWHDRKGSATRT